MLQSRRASHTAASSRAALLRRRRLSLERLEERSLLADASGLGPLLPPLSSMVPLQIGVADAAGVEGLTLNLSPAEGEGDLQAVPALLAPDGKHSAPTSEACALETQLPHEDDEDTESGQDGGASLLSLTEEEDEGPEGVLSEEFEHLRWFDLPEASLATSAGSAGPAAPR